ncbi:hypothetical protein D3875_16895 [Deinococcus cavernae]|uniref:Uncharacterized protein n=1 Tax=Deinococcus cavernae TaxID=2320857 RepID=A0A418VCT1_9DEIO|nr:hypothetical protein D3875_16895 [Deinococcus cavernae]
MPSIFRFRPSVITSTPPESFSEFRQAGKDIPHDSILRPAHLHSLASLGQKALRSFVRCARNPG